jgi:hypothetical protein
MSFIGDDTVEFVIYESLVGPLMRALHALHIRCSSTMDPCDPSLLGSSASATLSEEGRRANACRHYVHRLKQQSELCPRPSVRGWFLRRLREASRLFSSDTPNTADPIDSSEAMSDL